MNVLTFDLEDWFHILDNDGTRAPADWKKFEPRIAEGVDRILDTLSQANVVSTFFCLGWVAECHPAIVKRIHEAGHEIGSHSYAHQLVYEQSRGSFRSDLESSVKFIEDLTGSPVKYYRAPGFSVARRSAWIFDVLLDVGIEVDCSVFPAVRAHGGFSDFGVAEPVVVRTEKGDLKEFPINIAQVFGHRLVFSGGGYFRLLPYWVIAAMMRKASYVMTYFHPRDFDAGQPLLPGLSPLRRFKSYYGLSSAMPKLIALLKEFQFLSLSEACGRVDWASARVVDLRENA